MLLQGSKAEAVSPYLEGQDIFAPDLVYVEVLSALRRQVRRGMLSQERAARAVTDLTGVTLEVLPTEPLIAAIWGFRDNLSASDATYVALAESLDCPLITADAHLARAPTLSIDIITV